MSLPKVWIDDQRGDLQRALALPDQVDHSGSLSGDRCDEHLLECGEEAEAVCAAANVCREDSLCVFRVIAVVEAGQCFVHDSNDELEVVRYRFADDNGKGHWLALTNYEMRDKRAS